MPAAERSPARDAFECQRDARASAVGAQGRSVGGVRTRVAVALLGAVAVAGAFLALRSEPDVAAVPNSGAALQVTIERDGLVYEFSALSGTEYLWDAAADPASRVNLVPVRAADARRLRALLSEQLGVTDLEVLHAPYRATAESLRSMGYL